MLDVPQKLDGNKNNICYIMVLKNNIYYSMVIRNNTFYITVSPVVSHF